MARHGRFGRGGTRLVEAIKEQGDEQALALLETAQQERDAARAAMEAGDEEAARTHMEASREAMHEAVTIALPDYAERMEQARDWITARYSAKVYDIVVEKNGYANVAFDKGQIGGGQFMARLPS